MDASPVTLVARSSSHYSRIAAIYAHELGLSWAFEPVLDLSTLDAQNYANNPLLRVPSLRTPEGTWFGSLGICRELARRSGKRAGLVWPEDVTSALGSNAQEVVNDAMGTGVVIITGRLAGLTDDAPALVKPFARLRGAVAWLEQHLAAALADLPARQLSFLEVSSFCLLSHLEFRGLLRLESERTLLSFCATFGARPSAQATPYRFDQPPGAAR